MKIKYFSDTNTLVVELTSKPVASTDAITDDLILDYDNTGKIVSITIDNCSKNVDSVNLQALDLTLVS